MKPRINLIRNGRVIRAQPPVVGRYCKPPSSTNVALPCVYPSASCGGPPKTCSQCFFPFCGNHYDGHSIEFVAPVDAWKACMKRLNVGLNWIADNPRRHMPPFGPRDGEL